MPKFDDANYVDGVMRWKSNNRIPFEDMLMDAKIAGYPVDFEKCVALRETETMQTLEEYRRDYKGPAYEERLEARAAHGPGVELINVLTGTKFTT